MNDIKVGDRVKIRDFSGAVLENDFTMGGYGCHCPGARGTFEVLYTGMKLPSYDVITGQNRFNDVVLRSTTDKRSIIFSRAEMLNVANPPVTKYKVLYAGAGHVAISEALYVDLTDFQAWNAGFTPIHLILETAREVV